VGGNGSVFLLQTNLVAPAGRPEWRIANLVRQKVQVSLQGSGDVPGERWVLHCLGPEHSRLVVEISADLAQWHEVSAVVQETIPGVYRVSVAEAFPAPAFFRLRLPDPSLPDAP
jgi:hypothetical protein